MYEYTTSTAHTMPKGSALPVCYPHNNILLWAQLDLPKQHCCHLNCHFSTTLSQTSAVTASTELAELSCINLLMECKECFVCAVVPAACLVTSIEGPLVLRCLSAPLALCLQALQCCACLLLLVCVNIMCCSLTCFKLCGKAGSQQTNKKMLAASCHTLQ